jgi:DNA helicase-2/ATP-dependent DNA helicase PcrA
MIQLELFLHLLPQAIGRTLNAAQQQAVVAPVDAPLFIVAGPGTGKTAVLTLRILRALFIDSIPPHAILATTFTRRAANELRSRLISWGAAILRSLCNCPQVSPAIHAQLSQIDLSHLQLGTLDTFCQQFLREQRLPGTHPPLLADPLVSSALLLRSFTANRGHRDPLLRQFLHTLRGVPGGPTTAELRDVIQAISDRSQHDLVNWQQLVLTTPASSPQHAPLQLLHQILQHYQDALSRRLLLDFPALEKAVLLRLSSVSAPAPALPLQLILIDEYQDTNLLQEQIFFQLAKITSSTLTVVGDDDQSLYRFRGATVDLFRDFPQRHQAALGSRPRRIFLCDNHRSTASIIQFVNHFISLDSRFQPVRVSDKPPLRLPRRRPEDVSVLGLFRETPEELADSLARFLFAVIHGPGFTIQGRTIRLNHSAAGAAGDCALLCSSPLEYSRGPRPRKRLPLLLRQALQQHRPEIPVFNPRGQSLSQVPAVQLLGGLFLQCLDPTTSIQQQLRGLPQTTSATLTLWRSTSTTLLATQPRLKPLADFVDHYSRRDPGRTTHVWPASVPCIELLYALIHWLPEFHDSPAGQLWLEVFTRQLHATEQLSRFRGRILTDSSNPQLTSQSILHLLRHFLLPIAEDSITVDESLIDSLPQDHLNVLSIHQSKGLEFPLVIVDVGSDLQQARRTNAFRRFPAAPGTAHQLEDLLRPHSPLGSGSRDGINRAFDDLYRQYFVAFSRPRDVLVLAGLNAARPGGSVTNVACGWDRSGRCHWQKKPWCEIQP